MLLRLYCRHLLVWLFSILAFLGSQAAQAQQPETYAWTQRIGGTGLTASTASVGLDASGKAYGLYLVKSASGASISLRAFDVDGTPLFAKTVLSVTTAAEAKQLLVTKTGPTPSLLVACRYQLASLKWNTYLAMYDSNGILQWSHVYTNGTNTFPLGMDAPGDGFAYLASAGNFPSWHIQLEKLTTAGAVVSSHYNTKINPNVAYQAYHSGSTWVVCGFNPTVASSAMFGLFDDVSAGLKFAKTYRDHTTGTNAYHYAVYTYLYSGNALVIENFTVTPTVGTPLSYHVYWDYDMSGIEQWHSGTKAGNASFPGLGTGTNPSYVYHTDIDGNGHNVERLNSNGTVPWSQAVPDTWAGDRIAPDAQGFLFAGFDTAVSPVQAHLQRYNSNGLLQGNYVPVGGAIPSIASDGSSAILAVNGTGTLLGTASIMRYVAGFALLDVVPAATTLHTGGSTSFKIDFNLVAPTAGSAKIHSTSPLLTFGGMQDSTVSFGAGVNHVTVTGNVGTVSASTPAEVIVTINGVKRAAYLTLLP